MQDEKLVDHGIKVVDKNEAHPQDNSDKKIADDKEASWKKLMNYLKLLDLGGKPINLKYNGQDTYTSAIGGFLSACAIAGIVVYSITSFIFFIQRGAPIFSSVTETQPTPPEMVLKSFNLSWVVGVDIISFNEEQKKQTSINNHEYFNITVHLKERESVEVEQSYPLGEVDCNTSEAFMKNLSASELSSYGGSEEKNKIYDIYEISTALCFNASHYKKEDDKEYPVTLYGSEMTGKEMYIVFSVDLSSKYKAYCSSENSTAKIENSKKTYGDMCSEAKKKLKNAYVKYFFNHEVFQTNESLQNPVSKRVGYQKIGIQQFFAKQMNYFVQNNTVLDYYNIMNTQPDKSFIFSYSSTDISIDFVQESEFGTKPLLEIALKADHARNTFTRKYMNIKEFFVSIVGIINGLMAGGAGAAQFFNTMLLRVSLINKSFYIIQDDPQDASTSRRPLNVENEMAELDPNKSQDKSQEKSQDVTNNNLSKTDKDGENENQEEKRDMQPRGFGGGGGTIENQYKRYREKLRLSNSKKLFSRFTMPYSHFIFKLLPCCKNNVNVKKNKLIFDNCGDIIQAYFDIERIVDILREYEDYRTVAISEEEYKMVKQLTMPLIFISPANDVFVKKAKRLETDSKEIGELYSAFVRSMNKLIAQEYVTPTGLNLLSLHHKLFLQKSEKCTET